MDFHNQSADCLVPDGQPLEPALHRITHLGIGAHHDDLEFMAFHGILECYHRADQWFGGITCTDGAGSSRKGKYADCTDEQLRAIRIQEQRAAAVLGRYGAMIQLGYPSREVRPPTQDHFVADLVQILKLCRPQVIYTHNLADKHDTHIGVTTGVLHALRSLPPEQRPSRLLGCEVWRDLDWMGDGEKVALDVSGSDHLAAALNGVFDSQIGGGKRYDLAVAGRRYANATFFASHHSDAASQVTFAMDLTALIQDDTLDPVEYVIGYIDRFREDVRQRITAHWPPVR